MTDKANTQWFTEIFGDEGTSFGLAIKSKLHDEHSPFQHMQIYETETFGHLMVLDGCVMLTSRDNFLYHEMISHPALFTHPNPERVAIIGGGDCGTLKEVLKHSGITHVWQIDIDELVTKMSMEYFPSLCESNNDPRATLLFDDGIQWIKSQPNASLDIIIVDSTDPVGPAEGLFSVDFYADCRRALKPNGILVQQTESPLLHANSIIKNAHHDMQACGFNQTKTLTFPQPVYPSGWWSCTIASQYIDLNHFREQDAKDKNFATEYYNKDIHRGALATPEFMRKILEG